MDISDTLAPNSDQLDAVDLLSGPRTFLIERVSKGDAEQPVNIHLAEFPRPWRPGKSMRRVLVAAWGADASAYVGRRVQLYCDPAVSFGGQAVGGTRIAALSHIDKPKKVPLLVARGKSAIFTVQPLPDAPAPKPADDPLKALADAMTRTLELATREDKLAYLSGALGREIASAKDVTPAEATRLLQEIAREQQTPTAVPVESTVNSGDAGGSWPAVAIIPGTETSND